MRKSQFLGTLEMLYNKYDAADGNTQEQAKINHEIAKLKKVYKEEKVSLIKNTMHFFTKCNDLDY